MRIIIKITDEEKEKIIIDSIVAASNLDKSMKLVESYFSMGEFVFSNEEEGKDATSEEVWNKIRNCRREWR